MSVQIDTWEDIVYQFERMTYREVCQAIREVFPGYSEDGWEKVTAWLYAEGAFSKRLQRKLHGYSVELTPSTLDLYDLMGEKVATGYIRGLFMANVRDELGNRFMREHGLDAE